MANKQIKDVISAKKEITLGSKVFTIKSINIAGIADFQEYCLSKKKKEMIEVYKMAEMAPDVKEIMALTISEEDYTSSMMTLDGICYLLRKVINDNNEEQVDSAFVKENLDLENIQEISEIIMSDFMEQSKEDEKESKNEVAKSQLTE